MSSVKTLVLTGYGLNCDHETAFAFELAGATAVRVHINSLIDGSADLMNYQILVFVGGFSWGDDHGAGVIQAVRMKTNIGEKILEFVDRGNLVLGICNGFQALVNLGLLPGFDGDYRSRSVALTYNDCGNFRDDWVHLRVNSRTACVFTRGLTRLEFPVRHGEGKLCAEETVIDRLVSDNQVVLSYALPDGRPADGRFPHNPNGSVKDIAGICDPTGRLFGLMPHPEGFHHLTHHPDWARRKELARRGIALPAIETGMRIFQNGVDFFK